MHAGRTRHGVLLQRGIAPRDGSVKARGAEGPPRSKKKKERTDEGCLDQRQIAEGAITTKGRGQASREGCPKTAKRGTSVVARRRNQHEEGKRQEDEAVQPRRQTADKPQRDDRPQRTMNRARQGKDEEPRANNEIALSRDIEEGLGGASSAAGGNKARQRGGQTGKTEKLRPILAIGVVPRRAAKDRPAKQRGTKAETRPSRETSGRRRSHDASRGSQRRPGWRREGRQGNKETPRRRARQELTVEGRKGPSDARAIEWPRYFFVCDATCSKSEAATRRRRWTHPRHDHGGGGLRIVSVAPSFENKNGVRGRRRIRIA